MLEGEWVDVLDEKGPIGLTRVQTNLDNNLNTACRYAFLEDCEDINRALLLVDPTDADYDEFEVVDDKTGRLKSWSLLSINSICIGFVRTCINCIQLT